MISTSEYRQCTWSGTGSLAAGRVYHTATLLTNGKVLVAGRVNMSEIYDSITGIWSPAGSLITTREGHTATLLSNGKVLIVGGHDTGNGPEFSSAELYDPSSAYAITPSAGANGTNTPNTVQVVLSGTSSPTFTATPNSQYVTQWWVDGSLVQTGGTTYTFSNVTANHSL